MSTQGSRDFRPRFHYTPPKGWINDPNGPLYEDGIWHLFAQHYPHDTVWGPMHWIHATSKDLLNWENQGIALSPDERLGLIFSGSAIIDKGNTSGLGRERDPMICMYTHHGDTNSRASLSPRIACTLRPTRATRSSPIAICRTSVIQRSSATTCSAAGAWSSPRGIM